MQIEVASIRIRKRIRKDLRDIDQLAASMDRFGQLHPITVTRRNVLIAGRRRLEAARRLGWSTIEATVVGKSDAAQRLELEIEENIQRFPLDRDEIEQALLRLERLRNPGFLRRAWYAILSFFRRLFGIDDR
ncbi:MAG TPA: ParB N-terminal domain-containing protein [Spirochaetales bacterium]|nr:ParB N-terminal domain-containing protein [Spirochaetales bacterium]HPG87626.1 ParB N-terminal domain-containing protein [Spirochaetales bacterium]HPM71320.1 ParB N-terminal domain-containing protein [Spirochaetales bacterium]